MLKGNNVQHQCIPVKGLKPTTLNNATADSAWINEPWRLGRKLVFVLACDAPATTAATAKVIAKKRSDGSTVVLKDSGGVNDWAITAALFNDAGQGEGGKGIYAEVDLGNFDGTTYSDIALRLNQTAAVAFIVSVTAFITDLYTHPSGESWELLALQP